MRKIKDGVIKENPLVVLMLGLCSTMAISTTFEKSLLLGFAVFLVLTLSNVVVSLLKKWIGKCSYTFFNFDYWNIGYHFRTSLVHFCKTTIWCFWYLFVFNCSQLHYSRTGPFSGYERRRKRKFYWWRWDWPWLSFIYIGFWTRSWNTRKWHDYDCRCNEKYSWTRDYFNSFWWKIFSDFHFCESRGRFSSGWFPFRNYWNMEGEKTWNSLVYF